MEHHAHALHAAGPAPLWPMLLAAGLFAAYAWAATAERRRRGWSGARTASFAVGTALLALALSPPFLAAAHASLSGHMLQHLLLGMWAPVGLVLGAPGTLLLRRLPVNAGRVLMSFLALLPVRALIHPATAALLDIGGMYLLYLTPLYARAAEGGALHVLMHVHFVVSGYLFTWAIAGPDPAPHRPGPALRLGVLFAAAAAHAVLGKLMYARGYPRGTGAAPEDIEAAAQLMYYGGDLAELALAAMLFAAWPGRRRASAQAAV